MVKSFKKIFNTTSAPVIVLDPAGKILYVNDEFERLFGYRCADLKGSSRMPFLSAANKKVFRSRVRSAMKENRVKSFAVTVRCADRSMLDVRWHTMLVQEKAARKPDAIVLSGVLADGWRYSDSEIEESYRVIFENSGIGMAFIREDSAISHVNRELEKLSGYPRSRLEGGMMWTDFIEDPGLLDRLKEYHRLRRIDPDSVPDSYDVKVRRGDGEIRDILFSVAMIPGTTYSLASVVDITERKRTEETLRRSEEKYRSLVDNMQDTLYQCDTEGNITYLSPSASRLMTVDSVDELIGMNIARDLYPNPDDRATLLEKLKRDGSVTNHEVKIRRKDGSIIYLFANSHLYYDGDGTLLGVEGVFRDITEQKRAEEALRESEEKYRALVNNMQEVMYRADTNGKLVFITPSGARVLGYESPDDIIGFNLADEFYADPAQRQVALDEMRKHGSITNYEVLLKRRDGSTFTAMVNSHLLYDKKGVLQGVEGIYTDISERKRAEEDLKRSRKLLSDILQAASEFAIIATDPRGTITTFNRGAELMLGYSAGEMVGKKTPVAIHLESEVFSRGAELTAELGYPVEGFHVFVAQAELKGFETRTWTYVRKDGATFIVSLTIMAMRSDAGEITGYVGIASDITQHKLMEDRFTKVFMMAPDGISITRMADGMILDSNIGFNRISGWKRGEVLGRTSLELNFWDDPAERIFLVKELEAGREVVQREFRFRRRDGTARSGVYSARSITISGETCILFLMQDITPRKDTERILREKDERLRGITANMPGVVFQFYLKDTGEYGVSYASDNIKEEFGSYDDLDKLFPEFTSHIHEEDQGRFIESIRKAVDGNTQWNFEGRYLKPSGEMIWIHGISTPTRRDDRVVFDGILLNITERKHAEEMSRLSEDKFTKIFMLSPECIALTRLSDGMIVDVNLGFEKITGWRREEAVGRTSAEIRFWDNPADREAMVADLSAGRDVEGREFRFGKKDGAVRDGVYSARTIQLAGGAHLIFILNDVTERRETERMMREKDERLRGITENMPGVVFQFYATDSGEQGLSYAGDRMKEVFGLDGPLENIYREFSARIYQDDRERYLESIRQAVETAAPWNFEGRYVRPSGQMIWIHGLSLPTRHDDRLVFDGIMLNISERKYAEEMSRQAEDRFTKVFMATPDCIAITHLEDGQVIEVNPGFEDTTGWRWDEILGRSTPDINLWGDPAERGRLVEDLKNGRDVLYRETLFRRKDGSMRNVTYTARVINVAGNECIMLLFQDITDRKLAEEALRHSEQLFRGIVENATDLIYMVTLRGTFSYMSPAWREVMGGPESEPVGKEYIRYIHPDDAGMVAGKVHEVLTTGETVRNLEFRGIRPDGSIFWLSTVTSALRDAGGKIIGLMGIARDVTERKRTDEVLRASLEEKEILLKELYHRTKNNMQVVCGLLKLESTRTESPDLREVFTDIEGKIQAMALVHQKLYESQDLANLNLSEFVKSLSDLIMKNYSLSPGKLAISLDVESIPLSIDTIMPLGLVVAELITNSIKHAFPENRRGGIRIEIKPSDEDLMLDYRDDGIGLPEGFDPALSSTLGMNIIRNIAKTQLGGDIRFFGDGGFRCVINMKTNLYRRRL